MSNQIYTAIIGVMRDVGVVGKDGFNNFDKYKFRRIDAVMNALSPAMVKNKVFVIPEILEQTREERVSKEGKLMIYSITKVRYTFYTEDGSSVSAVVSGEGMDRGDKSINKAMSAAFKYACSQVFCIPTEEMKDSEQDSPEPQPKKKAEKKQPVPTSQPALQAEYQQMAQEPVQQALDLQVAAEPEKINRTEAAALAAMLKPNQREWILQQAGVNTLFDLTPEQYVNIINGLKAKAS